MGSDKLTIKQEKFIDYLFAGLPQREAYIKAGYSNNSSLAVIDVRASELASSSKVSVRIAELKAAARSKLIADEIERKERLSQFIREDITNKEGVVVRHSNIQAIEVLNKMENMYEQKPQYQDNRVYNILVNGGETEREKVARLINGEEPKQLEEG
jgi:phage terminase small subunit